MIMKTPTFMIVPSLACQASCKYCFGPHKGAVMEERTAMETVRFMKSIAVETDAKDISIIFHGGEPLLAPIKVWRVIFEETGAQLAGYKVKMNIQSNLWNLSDEILQLCQKNNVSIGTSLDGPKEICDISRGEGYFDRTWASVEKARASGFSVSGIATITQQTMPYTEQIAKFFRNMGMSMVLHGAVAGLDVQQKNGFALDAGQYAKMVAGLFPWYIKNRKYIQIETLDYYAKGVVWGDPGVCTFRDCLGMFLAISPTGDITSCQRLAGKEKFRMGNIFEKPTLAELYESAAAKHQRERESRVAERCAGCDIYPICKGGCYYCAAASGDGVIDPFCEAYQKIYAFVQEQVMDEMQSEENIHAIAVSPAITDEHPLLRKGAYISLSGKEHPARIADNARRILALYELSTTGNPAVAAQNLFDKKICGEVAITEKLLEQIRDNLCKSHKSLNNCYIHATFNCNLRCSHCYANAGESVEEMEIEHFGLLVEQAIEEKFRQIVITGGEPLMHTRRNEMLEICRNHRGRGTNLVLRTNLTGTFKENQLAALAGSFDQVVASVDGNEETHDNRRGKGTYKNLVHNLEEYVRISGSISNAAELSLTCVMRAAEINGEPGTSVNMLAKSLGVKRIRFRPLLPLGRAGNLDEPVMCEGLMEHVSPDEMLKSQINPLTTCGIGQNIFIKPDGGCYPCYAWCDDHTFIGNVFEQGLHQVLSSPQFRRLADCTVDTIAKCRDCRYRYLCGGACRAWGNRHETDLNAQPVNCLHLEKRAQKLIHAAMAYLKN